MKPERVASEGRTPNWLKASGARVAGLDAATGKRPVGRTVIDRFPWSIPLVCRGGTPMRVARRLCVTPSGNLQNHYGLAIADITPLTA